MCKIYKLLFITTIIFSYSSNADSVLATSSNYSLGPSFRSSGTILMPSNSWLSPITIPSSPISSPIGSSSTSLGISFGELSGGTASLAPISQTLSGSSASSPPLIPYSIDTILGSILGY